MQSLAGCAGAVSPALLRGWDPVRTAVVVSMACAPAEAYRRTMAAFAAEGLPIKFGGAAAGSLEAAPVRYSTLLGISELHYRATVAASTNGSEVFLTLGTRDYLSGGSESRTEPNGKPPWVRLQRIADRLRAP